jgi:hypothetical protein
MLEIFSELFLLVIGLHIQASTIIPTITPITMPAMDPLSSPVLPTVVVIELLVTVATIVSSDKPFQSSRRPKKDVIPAVIVVTVAGVDTGTTKSIVERDVTVAVIVAVGVAVAPLH